MNLQIALKKELKTHSLGQYINTEIGIMLVSLRHGHLFCNFFGNEEKGKLIFGHWKVNTRVFSNEDIRGHISYIREEITQYKGCLNKVI